MKKILIAIDDSKGSRRAVDTFAELFTHCRPEEVVLLYVEKIEGRSLMDEMLGQAELSTLKEELKGTRYQKLLDERAGKVTGYFRKVLEGKGVTGIRTVVREGHPADEILDAAKEEDADLIVVGSRAGRLHTLLMGSVSREVANRADRPVLIAR